MDRTPKADMCIKMIDQIASICYAMQHLSDGKHSIELTEHFVKKDQLKLLLDSEREELDQVKSWVNQLYFICCYRLIPITTISSNGSSSFIGKGDEEKEAIRSYFLDKGNIKIDEFDDFWYAITAYDEVTIDDLKTEVWDISDDITTIDKSYQIMKLKYKDVLSHIPEPSFYNYSKLIEHPKVLGYMDFVVKHKVATIKEIELLILRICCVVRDLNMSIDRIRKLYRGFIPSKESDTNHNTSSPQLPKELDSKQIAMLYKYLIENDWIEETDINSFNYIFGGDCAPSIHCITWSKSKTKQHLREMLQVIYETHIPFANIERIVKQVFIYKGEPMKLAKNKPTPSSDSDNLKKFLATL